MNVTTRTTTVYVLALSEDEAREAIQDSGLIVSALKRALLAPAHHRDHGDRPKAKRSANVPSYSCTCGASFKKAGYLARHQATCEAFIRAATKSGDAPAVAVES